MGITNYVIDEISASVKERSFQEVDVKNTFGIKDVRKGKVKNTLDVDWDFSADFKEVANISFKGSLVYFGDNIKEATETKKDRMFLIGEALREVSNFILKRGLIEAILISRTLQIPAPLNLPSVRVGSAGDTKKEAKKPANAG